MPSKVHVKGFEGLERALSKYGDRVEKEITSHVKITAQKIRNEAIKSINHGEKTGIKYKRGKKDKFHRASAKGEAPANDTGFLSSNITANFKGNKAEVESNAEYSNYLEVTLERPFMIPAMESKRNYWRNGILNIVKYQNRKGKK